MAKTDSRGGGTGSRPDSDWGLQKAIETRHGSRIKEECLKKIAEDPIDPIDPTTFSHFNPDEIKADTNYVARMKKTFAEDDARHPESKDAREWAKILEEILLREAEQSSWLGDSASTIKTAEYDDYHNGVDSVAEFNLEAGNQYLALAIDVTSGSVADKLAVIKGEIDTGHLTTVKYFRSSDETIEGSLMRVPRVVVGIDKTNLLQLAEMWLDRSKKKELGNHFVQLAIIDEIYEQLKVFAEYAKSIGKEDVHAIYTKQMLIIENIIFSKEKIYQRQGNFDYRKSDMVFKSLFTLLKDFQAIRASQKGLNRKDT